MTSFEYWYLSEDRVPETEEKVLCVTRTKSGVYNVVVGYYADGRWCCGMNSNVIAWAPLTSVYDVVCRKLRDIELLDRFDKEGEKR